MKLSTGWCSAGYFDDIFWNGSISRVNSISPYMFRISDTDLNQRLTVCPNSSSKSKLRKYLLEIDPGMFYEYWINGKMTQNGTKSKIYDLTAFNRDKKLKILIGESN